MIDTPKNRVTWCQIPAADEDRAWRFYGQVFGWEREEVEADHKLTGAILAEVTAKRPDLDKPRLVIRVDDIEVTLSAIRDAGGKVLTERQVIPKVGMAYAVFADSEGNILNIVADA